MRTKMQFLLKLKRIFIYNFTFTCNKFNFS
jgi:hypothetical protein